MKKEIIAKVMSELGKRKSEAKAVSSRENGQKGGRPVYKWSITYSRGTKGTCGKNEESIVTASTAKAAIKTALDTFDQFGDQIPKSKFKWHGDFYCASSGNWEEGFEATKFEK